jgi:uncharacterized protein YcgI (DUF1989 family)
MQTANSLWFIMPRHFDRTNYRKRRATDNTAPVFTSLLSDGLSVMDQTIPSCILWVNTSLEEAGYNAAFHMNVNQALFRTGYRHRHIIYSYIHLV